MTGVQTCALPIYGTTDSTAVSPVKERLPIIIITKAITTVIITPIPFTQGFTIPVIIMPPVTPSGWATMDTLTTAPMSTAMIITTPTGTAGANTGAVTEDTAETTMLGNIVEEGAMVVEAVVGGGMVGEGVVVGVVEEGAVMAGVLGGGGMGGSSSSGRQWGRPSRAASGRTAGSPRTQGGGRAANLITADRHGDGFRV